MRVNLLETCSVEVVCCITFQKLSWCRNSCSVSVQQI